jgi:hypothetical protein
MWTWAVLFLLKFFNRNSSIACAGHAGVSRIKPAGTRMAADGRGWQAAAAAFRRLMPRMRRRCALA